MLGHRSAGERSLHTRERSQVHNPPQACAGHRLQPTQKRNPTNKWYVSPVRLGGNTGILGILVLLAAATIGGCGGNTTTTTQTKGAAVSVIVTSPTSNSVIAGSSVTVRGTVSPPMATVQVQGHPAAVGNGVFTGAAELHHGRTTIDVIGSTAGEVPGSTSVVVVQDSGSSGNSSAGKSSESTATPSVAHEAPGQSGGQTPCGSQLTVGPDTTCSFAENVRAKYNEDGPGTYEIYSPVTEKTYPMTCGSGVPVVCTGGNKASVYFP